MQKAYNRINWENYPVETTPLNESNLNRMDAALNEIDNRVVEQETTKANQTDILSMISDVAFDETTGIFTFTRKNGATVTLDTKLEKLAMNWNYDSEKQKLEITLEDGTKQEVDLSALIGEPDFEDSGTIAFLAANGMVSAVVKEGSIEEKHLQPNYLADVKVEVGKAQNSAESAAVSATESAESAMAAKDYAAAAAESAEMAESIVGVQVTGVKGNAETEYRKGNINLTPANLGAAEANHTHDYAESGHTHNYAGASAPGGAATLAVKATGDSTGQQINTTYIKNVNVSGSNLVITKGDGTTSNVAISSGDDVTIRYNEETDKLEIYYDGEWAEWKIVGFAKPYIVCDGEFNSEYGAVTQYSSNGNIDISQKQNHVRFTVNNTIQDWYKMVFNTVFDMSQYSKLVIDVNDFYVWSGYDGSNTTYNAVIGITTDNSSNYKACSLAEIVIASTGKIEIPLTTINQNAYIFMEIVDMGSNDVPYVDVTNFYLE